MDASQQEKYLSRRSLIIASNRGPVTFQKENNGKLTYQRGTGGLVTALTGLIQDIDATWISCAISEEDNEWSEGQISLTDDEDAIYVKFGLPPHYDWYIFWGQIRQSSATELSPLKPSKTMRIFSSDEYCLRVFLRILRTVCSTLSFFLAISFSFSLSYLSSLAKKSPLFFPLYLSHRL